MFSPFLSKVQYSGSTISYSKNVKAKKKGNEWGYNAVTMPS